MRMVLAAAALAMVATTGQAADTPPATQTPAARLSLDTPIEAIVADSAGKAVLDADLPGVTSHEHYEMFKGMSLRALSGMAPDKLPADALAKVEADLAKIK